jgi:hypothetical protein
MAHQQPTHGVYPSSLLCLYHGTDLASANVIMTHGLDAAAAAVLSGTDEFWATTDRLAAETNRRVISPVP